jgi:CRISPR-associated protein Cas2
MTVLITERLTSGLRGELTRWMLELKVGVFVGELPAGVRDRLWDRVVRLAGGGAAHLIETAQSEQGFKIRSAGKTAKRVRSFDGLLLLEVPKSA